MPLSKFSPKCIYNKLSTIQFSVPFYDAFELTSSKETTGIAMLLFSTIFNRNEVYFGILVGLDSDYKLKQCTKKYLNIVLANKLSDLINSGYPNWRINYVLTNVLVNENIIERNKYINFRTPYLFKTPAFKDFKTGYANVLNDYGEKSVNFVGYPDVGGIKSSLLFIDDTIIKYHNNKPVGLSDPYGLAEHVEKNEYKLKAWADKVAWEHAINQPLIVDFIWCGGDIKPYSSVADIEKSMIVYFIGYYSTHAKKAIWKQPIFSINDNNIRIYDIRAIKQYRCSLNVKDTKVSEEMFDTFTRLVESDCPVGQYFNKPGKCGEGVVWHVEFNDSLKYFFFVKGSGQNGSNKKDTKNKIGSFISYALTKNRLEQSAQRTGEIAPKNLGAFITELYTDILSTEQTYIKNHSFDLEELEKEIWTRGARWFRSKYFDNSSS